MQGKGVHPYNWLSFIKPSIIDILKLHIIMMRIMGKASFNIKGNMVYNTSQNQYCKKSDWFYPFQTQVIVKLSACPWFKKSRQRDNVSKTLKKGNQKLQSQIEVHDTTYRNCSQVTNVAKPRYSKHVSTLIHEQFHVVMYSLLYVCICHEKVLLG